MSSLNQLLNVTKHAKSYYRAPTIKQKEFALQLGIDPSGHSLSSLSVAIDEGKDARYEKLCKRYDELDKDLQRSGHILDLAEKATTLKAKGAGQGNRWHCGPCPECADKGDDRFFVDTRNNLFSCRKCDFKGGVANLAAYVWGCHLWDAIDSLTGESPRKRVVVSARVSQKAPTQSVGSANEAKVIKDFLSALRASIAALRAPTGQAGRDYLVSRGITKGVWQANRVGFCRMGKRASVSFPHQLDGQVVGLNRRIIGASGKGKTRFVKGSTWGLYRLATIEGARALIITEGEINGLSIWQAVRVMGLAVDVASVGAEGAFKRLSPQIASLAKSYTSVLIWADEAKVADRACRQLAGSMAIQSPQGYDANDLLMRGALGGFLERVLPSGLSIAGEEVATVPMPDVLTTPTFPVTQTPLLPVTNDHDVQGGLTASEELLGLCAELADSADDSDMARALYLEAEQIYMWGDVTDLFEHYQKMSSQLAKQAKQLALLEV